MKKFVKGFTVFLSLNLTVLFSLVIYGSISLPDMAKTINQKIVFSHIYTAEIYESDISTVSQSDTEAASLQQSEIRLFGAIPVKNINIQKDERKYVIAGGELIGIRLKTDGVLVVGMQKFNSEKGEVCPAEECGIQVGDTLISINGSNVTMNSQLSQIFSQSDGKEMSAEIKRDGNTIHLTIQPQKDITNGIYKGGMWIRDSTGGIGTLTYTDISNGELGALGHGIYDVDTGKLMPTADGIFVSANLTGITKGVNGTAGELRGTLGSEYLGEINTNCENGIFGSTDIIRNTDDILPVALCEEISTGEAQIISTIDGKKKEYYDIKIEKINSGNENRNMIIRITDETLLLQTGGIVQGMSGSPIIQNGKIVGAVTHVFLNDPTKGYGIFIENMLNSTQSVSEQNMKDVS